MYLSTSSEKYLFLFSYDNYFYAIRTFRFSCFSLALLDLGLPLPRLFGPISSIWGASADSCRIGGGTSTSYLEFIS